MHRILIPVALVVSLVGCGRPGADPAQSATSEGDPARTAVELDTLYEEYWEALLELDPIQATFVGDTRYNDRLPNFLAADFRTRTHDFNAGWLTRARAVDEETLDEKARLSHEVFVRRLELELEAERFPDWLQPVNQFYSLASLAVQLGSGTGAQPFKTVDDYEDWLQRAQRLPVLFDQAIANMRLGLARGVVQPKVLMQKVLPQLDAVVAGRPEDTDFWGPIERMPRAFGEADRKRLTAAYRAMIGEQLVPAYQRLRRFIADEYLPGCRDTVALSALPDGDAWYAFNAKRSTTTDLTPVEIHRIGLKEVSRIHGEMTKVMQQVGFTGDLRAFFARVTTDRRFRFASEEALLKAYNGLRARVEAGVPRLFSLTPTASFEIRPVEPFRAASAAGGEYQQPSEDGSRPGIFYVNTYDLPTRKTWDMESLFLHEAVPGHHFQIALQQELKDLPRFRRFGIETAFVEGWGLYAESLGRALGVYTDPYQYFGRLQAELWRAIRLVVDTGLHDQDWTRERVIAYMIDNSATSKTQAVAEAERYIAIPGQALAYKIGELELQELRGRAENALGRRFDIKAFHAAALEDGSLPLDVLEAKIDRWIAVQEQVTPTGGR